MVKKILVEKYIFISKSFYLFISAFCAKILCMTWALGSYMNLVPDRYKIKLLVANYNELKILQKVSTSRFPTPMTSSKVVFRYFAKTSSKFVLGFLDSANKMKIIFVVVQLEIQQ